MKIDVSGWGALSKDKIKSFSNFRKSKSPSFVKSKQRTMHRVILKQKKYCPFPSVFILTQTKVL